MSMVPLLQQELGKAEGHLLATEQELSGSENGQKMLGTLYSESVQYSTKLKRHLSVSATVGNVSLEGRLLVHYAW